jgi:dihydroorotase
MKPPLRSSDHVEAIFEAIEDGTVDAIATDHAPHHHDEKNVEFDLAPFGIIGLETAFALGCEHLMHRRRVASLTRLVELFSSGPARIFNLPGGSLEEGTPADITLFDPDMEWTVEGFRSKAGNSPFRGQTLRGKVLATIVGGEVRYETPQVAAAGEGREKAGSRRKK